MLTPKQKADEQGGEAVLRSYFDELRHRSGFRLRCGVQLFDKVAYAALFVTSYPSRSLPVGLIVSVVTQLTPASKVRRVAILRCVVSMGCREHDGTTCCGIRLAVFGSAVFTESAFSAKSYPVGCEVPIFRVTVSILWEDGHETGLSDSRT